MPTIRDTQLKNVFTQLQGRGGQVRVGQQEVLRVLAAVGDRVGASQSSVLQKLRSPDLSRADQLDLVRGGMSPVEKADIENLLDGGTVSFDERSRNLLEALVGRASLTDDAAELLVAGLEVKAHDARHISGKAGAGATIEAINLSKAPGGRLHADDTVAIGKADAQGSFDSALIGQLENSRAGDIIQLRARTDDGKVTNWLRLRVPGQDQTNAEINVSRIALTAQDDDQIRVENITSRLISEPGATLRLVNSRTGDVASFVMNEHGSFPTDASIPGRAGDEIAVAVSDGVNNLEFRDVAATLTCPGATGPGHAVDLEDPALHKDELDAAGQPRFGTRRFEGPRVVGTIEPTDVQQGYLGNCYFASAMAALAQMHPEAINDMIEQKDDGTWEVTFKRYDWDTWQYEDKKVVVDGDLWARASGEPLYGTSNNTPCKPEVMEMWFPIIEKAYAKYHGSYDKIGSGGRASNVFEAVLGKRGYDKKIAEMSKDEVWSEITRSVDEKRPVSAGSHHGKESLYTNSGLYGDHAYTVLGYRTGDNGEKLIELRNPWGRSEPPGDGHDDGIFELKLDDFCTYFSGLSCLSNKAGGYYPF